MAIDVKKFRDELSEAFIDLLGSKRGTASRLAEAIGKPSSFINEVKRGKPVNSIHLKAVGIVYGPEKVLELLSLKDVYSGNIENEPDPIKVISEHQDLIKRYADPVQGKEINEQLIDIQDTDKTLFQSAVSSIKSIWDTAMTIRQVRGKKTAPEKNLKNGTDG